MNFLQVSSDTVLAESPGSPGAMTFKICFCNADEERSEGSKDDSHDCHAALTASSDNNVYRLG